VAHGVHPYPHDPAAEAYGDEAIEALAALGVEADRVFKTLVAQVDGAATRGAGGAGASAAVVAVVPVVARLDLKALATARSAKRATLAAPAAAERLTGYVLGGISPLGQKRRLTTVIDESAERWTTIFCSAGRRGLELEVAPGDLRRLTGATFAPIARR
jgi:Cys-tRNA(Pro)/Cys-tRNA(Cys) deacylase